MNCSKCIHHATIPGDAHLSCHHPDSGLDNGSLSQALSILSSARRMGPIPTPDIAREAMGITINMHGFTHGWANWPWNFDPIWIDTCNCFEERPST